MSSPESSQIEPQYKYISEVQFDFSESFEVSDYLRNPPLIRMLYQEKLRASKSSLYFEQQLRDTEKKLKDTEDQIAKMQASLEVSDSNLKHEREKSRQKDKEDNIRVLVQSILVVLGTTLLGFGVSWATSSPSNQAGWMMSIFGILIQFAAIAVIFLPKLTARSSDGREKVTSTN